MPQWIGLLAVVLVGWLALTVVGGLVIGRGLRAFEGRRPAGKADIGADETADLRRAA